MQQIRPDPIKSLEHLTTSISSMAFHPSSQLLATASSSKRDAFRLVSVNYLETKSPSLLRLLIKPLVPFAICYGLFQLAHTYNTLGSRYQYRILRWWRVHGCWEHERIRPTVGLETFRLVAGKDVGLTVVSHAESHPD